LLHTLLRRTLTISLTHFQPYRFSEETKQSQFGLSHTPFDSSFDAPPHSSVSTHNQKHLNVYDDQPFNSHSNSKSNYNAASMDDDDIMSPPLRFSDLHSLAADTIDATDTDGLNGLDIAPTFNNRHNSPFAQPHTPNIELSAKNASNASGYQSRPSSTMSQLFGL
jgi:hypothetical protein